MTQLIQSNTFMIGTLLVISLSQYVCHIYVPCVTKIKDLKHYIHLSHTEGNNLPKLYGLTVTLNPGSKHNILFIYTQNIKICLPITELYSDKMVYHSYKYTQVHTHLHKHTINTCNLTKIICTGLYCASFR